MGKILILLLLSVSCSKYSSDTVTRGDGKSIKSFPWLIQLGALTNAGGNNSNSESCSAVSVDASGNVFCAGATHGNLGETNGGNSDVFVMKLNQDGEIVWLTHFGSITNAGGSNSQSDYCAAITVDSLGNVYCAGTTTGGMSEANGGLPDAFVMKLNPSGAIVWHTQLGASTNAGGVNNQNDVCNGVAVDQSGNVYCAGSTNSAMSEGNGGEADAFVMKLDSSGNIIWHTQLGNTTSAGNSNSGFDECNGVSLDSAGNVYCAGVTYGGMSESNAGEGDAFVMKLNSSGNIVWHTQLGATTNAGGDNSGEDYCTGVAVDSSGNVFCSGATAGGMSESNAGEQDAFVMKLNSSGVIVWHTQLGSITNAGGENSGDDMCLGIAVDTAGNVYCGGYTSSGMSEPNGGNGGGTDAIVMKLNSAGQVK